VVSISRAVGALNVGLQDLPRELAEVVMNKRTASRAKPRISLRSLRVALCVVGAVLAISTAASAQPVPDAGTPVDGGTPSAAASSDAGASEDAAGPAAREPESDAEPATGPAPASPTARAPEAAAPPSPPAPGPNVAAGTPASGASPSSVAAEAASGNALEPVVVTARYRAEDVQDVPIPISTMSADQLKALGGTTNLRQVVQQLPSLNIQGYSGRNQTITIRGIGTNAGSTNDGLEQGVGIYIDGVYRPRTGTAITDLIDVESIQVLRGPQGTLFGKNTVAGAIDIRTAEPAFKRSITGEISYGNYNYVRGYVNVTEPITDYLTIKASYLRTSRDGWIYNATYNSYWDNLDNDAGRLDVLFKPNDHFKDRFIADYSNQVCNCGFQLIGQVLPTTVNGQPVLGANGKPVTGFYQHAAAVGYNPIAINPYSRRTDINSSQADQMPSWGLQNRADWLFDKDLALTSITAYRNWKWLPNFDGDQFGANVSPEGIVKTYQQQVSQELRLASPGGERFDYTAGLYYFYQVDNDFQYSSYGSQAAGWLVSPTTPSAVANNVVAFSHVVPATASYAVYGQTTWNLAPQWHLTGGLRGTYEHKTGSYSAYAAGGDPNSLYANGAVTPIAQLPAASQAGAAASRNSLAPSGDYTASHDVANLSWMGTFAHDFSDDIHAFVTYSRGYKSPGINLVRKSLGVNVFVEQETVDDYELGVKADFFGGRLELNPNVFYIIDQNFQANYINTTVTPIAGYITNVGTVVSRGAELDARFYPVQGLSGSAALMYDDAYYESYTNAPSQYLNASQPFQNLSGQQAAGAPRWTAAAAAEYGAPIAHQAEGTVDAYVGADWTVRSQFYAAVNLDPFSKINAYNLLGLHAGLRHGKHWDASFWMRNVADIHYLNTASVNSTYGITTVVVGEPRTFGVTVRGEL
jgi:iron complex outermembrane receptor protein